MKETLKGDYILNPKWISKIGFLSYCNPQIVKHKSIILFYEKYQK